MMKIIRKRQQHTEYHYDLHFQFTGEDGFWGFGFDCDENGNVFVDRLDEISRENYLQCLKGCCDQRNVDKPRIEKFVREWTDPAIGICVRCGEEVHLHSFTNECECGELYNTFGQQLAPREQWGEETGEHWSECW